MGTRGGVGACATFGSALVLAAMVGILAPPRAQACGGCFAPMGPTGTPTTVDAHRMVIAVGPGRTVLWDQIVYEGSPSDFVWVLPVAPGTVVELSDNTFFEGLTAATQITLQAPLPPRSFCSDPCGSGRSPFGGYGASAVDAGAGFVVVEHQGTVGPYDTATIASDDPDALLVWMNDHGYLVDDAMRPILAFYAAQHLSFAVLRLSSAAGVDRMQPVRVSMPGTSPSLPLRMVAAGAAVDLNLELFVFAEGRMEVSTYGNAEVDRDAITYDWASGTFDYDARFEDALFAGDGPGTNWVTEYAMPVTTWSTIASARRWIDGREHSPDADLEVVRSAFAADTALTLTRLRTRLRPNDLRDDLTVRASAGGELPGLVPVTRERNRAPDRPCPTVCESSDGLSPGGSATRGAGTRYRCSVEVGGAHGGSGVLGVLGALGALAVVARRRRGRRR